MYSSGGEIAVGWHAAGYKKQNRSAVCGGFLSLSGYKPLLGWKWIKMCSCKRNITFIISCQFQTGLRILKTLFDFYVFFKNLYWRRRIHIIVRVLYLDVCDNTIWNPFSMLFLFFVFLGWVDLAWHKRVPKWNSDLIRLQQVESLKEALKGC